MPARRSRSDARQRAETVTDVAGKYRLDVGKSGPYELSFALIAFGQVTKSVALTGDLTTVVDAVLPLAFTADVTVTGYRTFRSLADVKEPAKSSIGVRVSRPGGSDDIHTRPLQPRTARIGVQLDF